MRPVNGQRGCPLPPALAPPTSDLRPPKMTYWHNKVPFLLQGYVIHLQQNRPRQKGFLLFQRIFNTVRTLFILNKREQR
mgnify:CR=1 FL=1